MTSVSWNSNGSRLAVAYGKTDHVSWCEHSSLLHIWSISHRVKYDANKPDITIEVPNCLSSIAFHPEEPQLLAGGTVNGEILIWNLNDSQGKENSNTLIRRSQPDEYTHRERITKLAWTLDEKSQGSTEYKSNLVSISTDGKVLLWYNVMQTLQQDQVWNPSQGHIFLQEVLVTRNYEEVMTSLTSLAHVPGS